ncbi:hypothetical protein Klosneuvirus_4_2 [Klosneuvirus KNV1]|uniref:Uncharacterized protein n=1 Tax=Klosneuvirus KNV1 TaxID=1977640 RepID=A0A1V0SKD4_9VIRU|nr:hypothetical protein Klosneuvirus_4_2 [Klosneuvirus KNV1]
MLQVNRVIDIKNYRLLRLLIINQFIQISSLGKRERYSLDYNHYLQYYGKPEYSLSFIHKKIDLLTLSPYISIQFINIFNG